jgi:carbon starvation protein
LMQELLARASRRLGDTSSRLGGTVATGLVVFGWAFLILTGNIQTLWPLFGVANQLLACIALAVGTTLILREAPKKIYAVCTLVPLAFVGTTTLTAAVQSIRVLYLPMTLRAETRFAGWLDASITAVLLVCVTLVLGFSARSWIRSAAPTAAR